MMIEARLNSYGAQGPDLWDDQGGIYLPLDHVICRDLDGTPHTVREFIWPWTAYTSHKQRTTLHFYYWKQAGRQKDDLVPTPEREARMRELQFLMTRQLYFGNENAVSTLNNKLQTLHRVARFAEQHSCTVRDVLTHAPLLDACGANLPDRCAAIWMGWLTFLRDLDPETELGFEPAKPSRWDDLYQRAKRYRDGSKQYAPLPTRIYAALINNVSAELDDIEAHGPRLLAALREAIGEYQQVKATNMDARILIGPRVVEKYGLTDFLRRYDLDSKRSKLGDLGGIVGEIFRVCKLQIHLFSGMRYEEARQLPYHCMDTVQGRHGRRHCLVTGATTKFNKGRRLRTRWVTTENEGFRAIRLAQQFATVVYEAIGVTPATDDDVKDEHPLFPAVGYLPWDKRQATPGGPIVTYLGHLGAASETLLNRLCPSIEDEDVVELEEIDPFRSWREEPEFAVGTRWPLTTHQLRRSLAIYANASGLVRLSSLRRQLQHLTREMSLYYGRGSTFCKNFIAEDPDGYKNHIAPEWQDGAEEADVLAFVRDVLNSMEPMFGGAGTYYERQRERGDIMSREKVAKQMKAGLLSYREGPLGGCIRPGVCDSRKGLTLIDTACATDGCKHLIGKHSKIVQTIRLKRAAMANIAPGSITEALEREDLEALERIERQWRPTETGGPHG
jgi:hypothetical protein